MAKSLNRIRIRATLALIVATFVVDGLTAPSQDPESLLYLMENWVGYFLIMLCLLGRLVCTAFIGGQKNQTLVIEGPFSVCRNPLYACSFLGVVGLGLLSNHVSLLVGMPLCFGAIYLPLIRREEGFLLQQFGLAYADYCRTTPRLFPKFSAYHAPEFITTRPIFMLYALRDSVMWFAAILIFEYIDYAQRAGILSVLFTLP